MPTPLFFHESWQGTDRAQSAIISYPSVGYSNRQVHRHLPTCSGFSLKKLHRRWTNAGGTMHEVIAEGEPDILETAQAQQEPDEKDYTQVA